RGEPELVLVVDSHLIIATGGKPHERAQVVDEAELAARRSRNPRERLVVREIGRRTTKSDPVDNAGDFERVARRAAKVRDVGTEQTRQNRFGESDARR